ncbi:MAG: M64 family metallopeptidase [Odoribacter sp.]
MIQKTILFLCLLSFFDIQGVQAQFEKYFFDKTMRFDYYHCGNQKEQTYFFDELKEEPYWAGSKISLLDTTGYGVQLFKIRDKATGKEIYSRGFCTLFNEWQTTAEAQTIQKAMPEAVIFPYPKNAVTIEIYARNRAGVFEKKFQQDIQPDSYFIRPFTAQYETFEVAYNGPSDHRVDLVLIPEGYSDNEKDKFVIACKEFANDLFRYSPYKENATRFNIRAVWAPSKESGVTLPGEHIWRNTATHAQFYTFDSERYQMIEDYQGLRDIAAHTPYDYIYVLSNTQKYGGGGIFNSFGISAAHNSGNRGKIYVHEFGHVLLGLGDEYVGNVSYNEMYPTDVEPWEANLTTLVDFDRKDWKKMIAAQTPIPTPATFHSKNQIGVYEGGGYVNKGVYRPSPTCLMKEFNGTDEFCPVCKKAIQDYIHFLCR